MLARLSKWRLLPTPTIPTIGKSEFEELKAFMVKEVKTLMAAGKKPPKHYCWTHGVGNHDSKSCKFPKLGHVENATAKKNLVEEITCIKREKTEI